MIVVRVYDDISLLLRHLDHFLDKLLHLKHNIIIINNTWLCQFRFYRPQIQGRSVKFQIYLLIINKLETIGLNNSAFHLDIQLFTTKAEKNRLKMNLRLIKMGFEFIDLEFKVDRYVFRFMSRLYTRSIKRVLNLDLFYYHFEFVITKKENCRLYLQPEITEMDSEAIDLDFKGDSKNYVSTTLFKSQFEKSAHMGPSVFLFLAVCNKKLFL